jgi:tRNA(Ile)-lysidine synthase
VRHDPAVAATRAAVRSSLRDFASGSLVLAAVSGGADSLALAAALAHEAPRHGLDAGAVTVDHGLQAGSADRAQAVVATCTSLGLDPVRSETVAVRGPGGPEAAARTARYAALETAAADTGAAAVLLGHTLDDQAETVLLRLARGSGARSLAGMPARNGTFRRPFLQVRREQTAAACAALGLTPWADPHNTDPAYARSRVRGDALPALERTLGPGIAAALARTAGLLRDDADALDDAAAKTLADVTTTDGGLDVAGLAALAPAVRTRVLRAAAVAAGSPPGSLGAVHVAALDALVTGWHGQGPTSLPGGLVGERRYGRLTFR